MRHGWWPGWIWAIPIAALIVVIWLGARALLAGGTDITIRFIDVHEIKTENTDIVLRGAQVGHVTGIKLTDDGTGVIVAASINAEAVKFLTAVVQLDAALRQIHGITAKAGPQNGLGNTVQEITDAARAVRSLADYLDRHPEALVRGREGNTP